MNIFQDAVNQSTALLIPKSIQLQTPMIQVRRFEFMISQDKKISGEDGSMLWWSIGVFFSLIALVYSIVISDKMVPIGSLVDKTAPGFEIEDRRSCIPLLGVFKLLSLIAIYGLFKERGCTVFKLTRTDHLLDRNHFCSC